jgi:hypothetical protein
MSLTRLSYSRSRLARLPASALLCSILRSLHSPQPTIRLPVTYSMPLQIAIIGAGIAGLSAAIGLRRAGHDAVVGLLYSPNSTKLTSQIYERSRFKNEVGAAIVISPNGTLVLNRWGFDFDKAGAIDNCQVSRKLCG